MFSCFPSFFHILNQKPFSTKDLAVKVRKALGCGRTIGYIKVKKPNHPSERYRGMKKILLTLFLCPLAGCLGYPETVEPVTDFNLERYLGTWYEIARLDHPFERGLERVTAEYSLRPDGGIRVRNRGFSRENNEWNEAVGKAYFVRGPEEGYFKVSFFGPFYGSYVIFELDKEGYEYAFVTGSSKSYLWLLSRAPTVGGTLKKEFLKKAEELGFETEELIWVHQE